MDNRAGFRAVRCRPGGPFYAWRSASRSRSMLPPMRGAGASIVSRARVRVRSLPSPKAMNRRSRRAPDRISAQRRVDWNGAPVVVSPGGGRPKGRLNGSPGRRNLRGTLRAGQPPSARDRQPTGPERHSFRQQGWLGAVIRGRLGIAGIARFGNVGACRCQSGHVPSGIRSNPVTI